MPLLLPVVIPVSEVNPILVDHDDHHSNNDSHNHDDRTECFQSAAEALAQCGSFQEVQEAARTMKDIVDGFFIPLPSVTAPIGSTIDTIALGLLQPAVQERCFPSSVEGDGNCFCSLSLVLFGTEACFEEMRCRIAMAMALAPNIFLDGSNWCSEHDQVTPESVIQVAVLTSVAPDESPAGSLEREVMSVLQNRSYTGLWEFLSASYVLKRPILSVFPPLGWELYRVHCNRIIRAPGCNMDEKIAIMWSSVR